MREFVQLLRCFGRLWRFGWPMLLLVAAGGAIANDLLLPLAVQAGFVNGVAGLTVLSVAVLIKLVVVVLMFLSLRPMMPAVAALQSASAGAVSPEPPQRPSARALMAVVAVAIIPFFGYYAAWGFLGDTVREYSLLALSLAPLGERVAVLEIPDSRWLVLAVLLLWAVRRFAKAMRALGARPVWQFVIVLCDANWVFIGLYVLSRWKDAAWAWIAAGGPLPYLLWLRDLALSLIGRAQAASLEAVDLAEPAVGAVLQGLALYALLPLVWLLMAAVIYGYDVGDASSLARHRRAAAVLARYGALPKFLRDFIEHFIAGYRSRYLPVVNSVRLAFSAGLPALLALVLLYRAIGWAGAWAWIGLARLIGPHDLTTWQMLASPIGLLLGGPSDIRGGILVDSLRICLVAAVMERAVAVHREAAVTAGAESADNAAARPAG